MDSPADLGFDYSPNLPVPISLIGGRYLLFDVKIATYLRREHNICGITIGTLPLSPSQNLFLGVPIEIMPEEAQLLVERGVGVVVDEARVHDQAVQSRDLARRADYLAKIEKQSKQVKHAKDQEKQQSRRRALGKNAKVSTPSSDPGQVGLDDNETVQDAEAPAPESEALFQDDPPVRVSTASATSNSYFVTPATSRLLLPTPPASPGLTVENLPSSYPLYRHLHDGGFFMTPGLRFGCQYTVYPGDPLRFHSHFLAVGAEWDEEIDLMDIVAGGRLGTGVKKGFLLGGASPKGDVRTFSVEWAAM
ncbi:tRNA-intron endonuclease [Fonsecaea erecta]|uniref:tRNA-splicing endonuclease subunit Sen34 n=1 Tax=Fonsecaea erecta TaxID=1367422 RepID=A0A178ZT03_9EURO|nr:tRNA-intron endonuclease [Fonsecaea erecta]OAP62940.1 tRNA-intron endonuclease [Fonsecaea erecta]